MELIKYYDHFEMEGYVDQEGIDSAKPIIMTSRGNIMREDDLFIFLSSSDVDHGSGHLTHGDVHCIVKGAIISRKKAH